MDNIIRLNELEYRTRAWIAASDSEKVKRLSIALENIEFISGKYQDLNDALVLKEALNVVRDLAFRSRTRGE